MPVSPRLDTAAPILLNHFPFFKFVVSVTFSLFNPLSLPLSIVYLLQMSSRCCSCVSTVVWLFVHYPLRTISCYCLIDAGCNVYCVIHQGSRPVYGNQGKPGKDFFLVGKKSGNLRILQIREFEQNASNQGIWTKFVKSGYFIGPREKVASLSYFVSCPNSVHTVIHDDCNHCCVTRSDLRLLCYLYRL